MFLCPSKSLDGTDSVTRFQQVRYDCSSFWQVTRLPIQRYIGRVFHGAVNGTVVSVPPNLPARLVVLSNERKAEQKLPPELGAGYGDPYEP